MEAIILSGLPAAGKTTVSGIISEELHIRAIGIGDILKEIASRRGYKITGEDWWDTPDGIKFLKERETNSDFDKEADLMLVETIIAGNVVITSYTAPWLTEEGYKVWLVGSVEKRAERMAKRDGTNKEQSERVVKIRDEENKKIYKNLYNINFGVDMLPFNLVVNTNNKTAEEVAAIIIKSYTDYTHKKQ